MHTPIVFIIFNRPDTTERVFAEIAKASPKKLFVIADGPRDGRPDDAERCAAAGLSIPIASFVKSLGKVSIDLGGHLQFLFGAIGKRWRERENERGMYFNESWIDMPKKYKPKEKGVCDNGAYW